MCAHTPTKVGAKCDGGAACDGNGVCTGGALMWAREFGDSGAQTAYASAVDPAGNVLLAATNDSTIDFGGGPLQAVGQAETVLAKLDKDGKYVWAKRLPSAPLANGSFAVATDTNGNLFLSGKVKDLVDVGGGPIGAANAYQLLIAKFDPSGQHLWSKAFGDPTGEAGFGAMATDPGGNVVITGYYAHPIDFGGGPLPAPGGSFMVKLNGKGAHVWSRAFKAGATGEGVAVGAAGDIVFSGSFQGSLDLGGLPLLAAPGGALFLARLDSNGVHVWSKAFDSASTGPIPQSLAYGADRIVWFGPLGNSVNLGGTVLLGAGNTDIFLASFGIDGGHVWSKRFGDAQMQTAGSVAMTSAGDLVIAAYSQGTGVDFGGGVVAGGGGGNSFVAKFAKDGTHLWSKGFVSSGDDGFLGVSLQPSGNVVASGACSGSPDFGAGPVACKGVDAAVASFGP